MAEVKNLFVKSKMNKDLDARLLTNGEYRDAQNVSVSKSEGADVGAVENILGNIELIDFETIVTNAVTAKYNALGFTIDTDAINYKNLEVIGQASNMQTDSVVVFLTDWTDTSNNKLSNFPGDAMVTNAKGTNVLEYAGPGCFICYYNFQTGVSSILAAGSYLNFSKSHPILGADYLEDFLYFTDNRNQPRKINVSTALARPYTSSSPYYGNEDNISVCKYAPYESIGFVDASNNSTLITRSEQFLPSNLTTTLNADVVSTNTFVLVGAFSVSNEIAIGGRLNIPSYGESHIITNISVATNTTVTTSTPSTTTIPAGTTITVEKVNPDYDSTFSGDKNLLKEEFPRYSYRYRYDDGEYSLMAPFSQIAFIPEQYGYFLHDDERLASESGIVKFVENKVDQIFMQIPMPALQSQLANSYKISELQILAKNAGETTVSVIEDIPVVDIIYSSLTYSYRYDSTKPFKVLPEKDITRVSDKAPIRAASQAIIGNRIVYGNFLDKHTHPISLDFNAKVQQKENLTTSTIRKEYPNHTLKQNRNYQIGLVLMDRYGRSSGVITGNNLISTTINKNSTVYAEYTNGSGNALNWPGDCLTLVMNEPIPSGFGADGYPGIYGYENPLGWYSYKVVVKQTEQEYYNVYVPGAIAGNITWNKKEEITKVADGASSTTTIPLSDTTNLDPGMTLIRNNKSTGIYIASISAGVSVTMSKDVAGLIVANEEVIFQQITYPTYPNPYTTSNIVLFGDNINKVPRDLNKVGPTDRIYASDVRLFNRVNPIFNSPLYYNTQHVFKSPLVGDEAVSIRPFRDLGEWALQSSRYYPVSTTAGVADEGAEKLQLFYKANDNPFIATLTTNSLIGINPVLNTSATYTDRTLGVFETEPTTSLLDIFWETSTSGLVSDLNTSVNDTAGGPVGFTDVTFNLIESDAIGTLATNYFELINSAGNVIGDASQINMSNLTVLDGFNQDRSNDFQLIADVTAPNVRFAIQTTTTFYYGTQAGTLENYRFTISCVANGISTTLTLPQNYLLSNLSPYVPGNMQYVDVDDSNLVTDTFTNIFPSLPYTKYVGEVELTSPNSNTPVNLFSFKIHNGSLITTKDTNETLVSVRTHMDFVSNIKDRSKGIRMNYDTSTKTYTLTAIPKLIKDAIKDYPSGFEPDWTFDFTLYDVIPFGGPGEFVEALIGPGPYNWFPTTGPQPATIGNNTKNFKFTAKFKYK